MSCIKWKRARNDEFLFLQISEQIHEQRRCQMPREPGVGAELTSPPPGEDHQYNKNDKHFLPPADLSQDEKVCYLIYGVVQILHLCILKYNIYIFLDKNNVRRLFNIY